MKNSNFLNLFWAIVWGLVTALCIVGIFWNSSQIIVAILAFGITLVFLVEYFRFRRLK